MVVRVCFVTNEMYPASPGGIGRLMYNFAVKNASRPGDVEFHYLLPSRARERSAEYEEGIHGLGHVHFCPDDALPNGFGAALDFIRKDESNFETVYVGSLQYLFGLKSVQRDAGFEFDHIEFPDFGGWAFASIQAKAAGQAFLTARIVVRLHSTIGLIARHERFYQQPSEYLGAVMDQERYCLQHADLVVAHLTCIAARNAAHYGFGPEWLARVRVEFPPIIIDELPASTPTPAGTAALETGPVFVFSSRLQPFKRPDVFISAAVRFMRQTPLSPARFFLISYGWDEEYIAHLEALIPADLNAHIVIRCGVSPGERRALLETSIVVVPSDYESLCLFAYEAALLGARVILNRGCAAFGQCERWMDGENCLLFDDDFIDLAETMRRALAWTPTRAVDVRADVPYWASRPPTRARIGARLATPPQSEPALLIVALGDGVANLVADFCLRLSRMYTGHARIVVMLPEVPAAQAARFSALVSSLGWTVSFASGGGVHAAEIQRLVVDSEEDLVVFLPQEFNLGPNFIRSGVQAMQRNPALALFSSHVGLVNEDGSMTGLVLCAGQMPSLALQGSSVCARACMVRRSAVLANPLDERARDLWLEVFCREIVLRGLEVLIAPWIALTCRLASAVRRSNSLLDATLRDEAGLRAGLVPRLISVVTHAASHAWRDNPRLVIEGSALATIRRVLPIEMLTGWSPILFKEDFNAAQIHPIEGALVVGYLQFKLDAKPVRIECRMKNAHTDNMGFEVAALVRQDPLSPDEIRSLGAVGPDAAEWTEWHFLPADTQQIIILPAIHVGRGHCHLYIATRLRHGAHDYFAWAFLESVKIF